MRVVLLLALVVLASSAGCSRQGRTPGLPELEPGVWTRIEPGGGTICADGSEFSFFVRPGARNRVVVGFMGGGACWDAKTCGQPLAPEGDGPGYYYDHVSLTAERLSGGTYARGLLDVENPENPIRDWYQVFVPYCTGDLHLGDATVDYGEGLTVRHRGATNARAALSWVEAHFEAPERVFVAGCSAGAYASIFWTPWLRARFPGAAVAQLGDAGAGVVTASFMESVLYGWNMAAVLPDAFPGLAPGDLEHADALERLYRSVASVYPEVALAQYNTRFDGVQTFYYAEMLGVEPDLSLVLAWSERMERSLDALEADLDGFDSYVASFDFEGSRGTPHCITPSDDSYQVTTNGVPFLDWLARHVNGEGAGKVRPPR